MEQWNDISGFEGLYQVSNLGRVRSFPRLRFVGRSMRLIGGKIMNPTKTSIGYLVVSLCNGKIKKSCKVHRLVASAFIHNLQHKPDVNHIDSNRHNNHVSNLEWCTPQENVKHGIEFGFMGSKGGTNHNAKPVLHLETGVFFDCLKDGAICFGINYSTLKNLTNGNQTYKPSPFVYL